MRTDLRPVFLQRYVLAVGFIASISILNKVDDNLGNFRSSFRSALDRRRTWEGCRDGLTSDSSEVRSCEACGGRSRQGSVWRFRGGKYSKRIARYKKRRPMSRKKYDFRDEKRKARRQNLLMRAASAKLPTPRAKSYLELKRIENTPAPPPRLPPPPKHDFHNFSGAELLKFISQQSPPISATALFKLLQYQRNVKHTEKMISEALNLSGLKIKNSDVGEEDPAFQTGRLGLNISMFEAACILRLRAFNNSQESPELDGLTISLNMTRIKAVLREISDSKFISPRIPRSSKGYCTLGQLLDRRRRICRVIIGLYDVANALCRPTGQHGVSAKIIDPNTLIERRTDAVISMLRMAKAGLWTFDVDGPEAERISGLFLRICPPDLKKRLTWMVHVEGPGASWKKEKTDGFGNMVPSDGRLKRVREGTLKQLNQSLHRMCLPKVDVAWGRWVGEQDERWFERMRIEDEDSTSEEDKIVSLLHRSLNVPNTSFIKRREAKSDRLVRKRTPKEAEDRDFKMVMKKAENPPPGLSREDVIQREIARLKGFSHIVRNMEPGDKIAKIMKVGGSLIRARKGGMLLKRPGENVQAIPKIRESKRKKLEFDKLEKKMEKNAIPRQIRFFNSLYKTITPRFGSLSRMVGGGYTPGGLVEYLVTKTDVRLVSVQAYLSVLDQRAMIGVFPAAMKARAQIIGRDPTVGGLLTDDGVNDGDLESRGEMARATQFAQSFGSLRIQKIRRVIRKIAKRYQVNMESVAVRWSLAQPEVSAVVIPIPVGVYNPSPQDILNMQIDSSEPKYIVGKGLGPKALEWMCESLNFDLDDDEIDKIDRAVKPSSGMATSVALELMNNIGDVDIHHATRRRSLIQMERDSIRAKRMRVENQRRRMDKKEKKEIRLLKKVAGKAVSAMKNPLRKPKYSTIENSESKTSNFSALSSSQILEVLSNPQLHLKHVTRLCLSKQNKPAARRVLTNALGVRPGTQHCQSFSDAIRMLRERGVGKSFLVNPIKDQKTEKLSAVGDDDEDELLFGDRSSDVLDYVQDSDVADTMRKPQYSGLGPPRPRGTKGSAGMDAKARGEAVLAKLLAAEKEGKDIHKLGLEKMLKSGR
ncbi:hypothetical protein AAMO2058_001041000 [Amorphochlora amoebiformis]